MMTTTFLLYYDDNFESIFPDSIDVTPVFLITLLDHQNDDTLTLKANFSFNAIRYSTFQLKKEEVQEALALMIPIRN